MTQSPAVRGRGVRFWMLVVVLVCAASTASVPSAAAALTFNIECGTPSSGHCYSVTGTDGVQAYTGIRSTITASAATPGRSTAAVPSFVTNEVWLVRDATGQAWVETGFYSGYVSAVGTAGGGGGSGGGATASGTPATVNVVGYVVFVAYFDETNTFRLRFLNGVSPNGAAHTFQLAHPADDHTWQLTFDGLPLASFTANMTEATLAEQGGELAARPATAAPYPAASRASLQSSVQTPGGDFSQPLLGSWTTVHPALTGTSSGPGQWSWSTK